MISAFGVNHGEISKAVMPDKIPDWASGAVPASTARAYNQSQSHKKEAAARNFTYRAAGAAVGTAIGAGMVGLAFRKAKPMKYMPEFFYRPSKKVPIPFSGGKKTTIGSGEKQRYLGGIVGGPLGAIGGGAAGAGHLKHMQKDPKFQMKEDEKE